VIRTGNTTTITWPGGTLTDNNTNPTAATQQIGLGLLCMSSGTLTNDWVRVRKYYAPGVSVTLGAETFIGLTGTTIHVDSAFGNDNNDGATWATAFKTLSYALKVAQEPGCYATVDSILVAKGTYYPAYNAAIVLSSGPDRTFAIVRDSLAILGAYPSGGGVRDYQANPTILSGDIDRSGTQTTNDATSIMHGIGTVANPIDTSLVIDGLIFERCGQGSSGGGLSLNYASPKISNCIFRNNVVNNRGAGIYANYSNTIIDKCGFFNNAAPNASIFTDYSNIKITDCVFSDNSCSLAASVLYSRSSKVTIDRCTFKNETAGGSYGGLFVVNSSLINSDNIAMQVSNSLFVNNTSTGNTGLVVFENFSVNKSVSFVNNTISNNNFGTSSLCFYLGSNDYVEFKNNIINIGNTTLENVSNRTRFNNNLTNRASFNANVNNSNNIFNATPGFINPAGSNFRLLATSPALNMGNNSYVPSAITKDLDGNDRIIGTNVDIGAYEIACIPTSAIHVDSAFGNDNNNGATWATAFKTLSYALKVVQESGCYENVDSILVAKGTYYPTGVQNGTNRDSSFVIFRDSLTILGGYSSGGGNRNWDVYPTIMSGDIGVLNNNTDNSHHVMVFVGKQTNPVLNILVEGFVIEKGYADLSGTKVINGYSVGRNVGGGVVIVHYISPTLSNLIIRDNYANIYGGGIFGDQWCDPKYYNLLIYKNRADSRAAAIYNNWGTNPVLSNSTLVDNTGSSVISSSAGWMSINNSIIYGNSNDLHGSNYAPFHHSLIQGNVNTANSNIPGNINPLFVNPSANDYRLQSTSPAKDGGNNALVRVLLDRLYNQRIDGCSVDMGAFEVVGPTFNIALVVDTVVCQGESVFGYTATGNYRDTFLVATNCYDIRVLNLIVNPIITHGISQTICQQDLPFVWNSYTITTVGNYTLVDTTASTVTGCDSMTTLSLIVNPTLTRSMSQTICQQDLPFVWNSYTITTVGNYTLVDTTASTVTGCDSMTTLSLIVNPTLTRSISQTICQQDLPFVWNSHSITTVGSHTLRDTTASTVTGCDSITTLNLIVNPTLTRSISQTICEETLPFVWNSYTITTVGSHTLRDTTASTVTGCDSITTMNLIVNPSPIVHLGNDTNICANIVYSLNGTTPGGISYLWSTSAVTPTINIASAGTYHLAVTDANNCTGRDTIVIGHLTVSVVNLGADQTSCIDSGWSYTLNAGNAGASYLWDNNTILQTRTVTQNGSYHVAVTNSLGCVNSDTVEIAFRENPIIHLTPDTNICIGDTIVLDAIHPQVATYTWNTGATTPSILAFQTYLYKVNVVGTNGCLGSDSTQVIVRERPYVDLGSDINKCVDQGHLEFLNARNAGNDYLWDNNYNGQVRVIDRSGSYWVGVTNQWKCSSYDTIQVNLKWNPLVDLGNDTMVCDDVSIELDAGAGGISYIWNTGAATPTIRTTKAGDYYVNVVGENGCVGMDTVHVSFGGKSPQHNGIWVRNVNTHSFRFSLIQPSSIGSYEWDFGDGTPLSYLQEPVHTYTQKGNYIVRLKLLNSCGQAMDTTTVHILSGTAIDDVSVSFSVLLYPNPANDKVGFKLSEGVVVEQVYVYNVLGQLVYQEQYLQGQVPSMDVSLLSSAMYTVRIHTNKGVVESKLDIIK
jgi:hypothetical protein